MSIAKKSKSDVFDKALQIAKASPTYRKPQTRMHPDERKKLLDAVPLKRVKAQSIHSMTRKAIAADADVSTGLIHRYYGDLAGMRKAALVLAFEANKLDVIKRAVADGYAKSDLPKKIQQAIK